MDVLQNVYPQALTNNDNRTGGATFNEAQLNTNNSSGIILNPAGTNNQIMAYNTNSAGVMTTNIIKIGGSPYNLEASNTNNVDTFTVTQDGIAAVGTNATTRITLNGTNGNISATSATLSSATASTFAGFDSGKNIVTQTQPGYSIAGNNGSSSGNTAAILVSQVATFASATNSLQLAPALYGTNFLLVSATPCNITNAINGTAGYLFAADLTISNSTAATFTCRVDTAWMPRGWLATNIATGTLGFNGVTVAGGKEAFLHVEARGINETNYWVSY
jgi:hypothetical protein